MKRGKVENKKLWGMAFSKSKLYADEYQKLCGFTRAFGHEARLLILDQLCLEGRCTVEELNRDQPISQGALSDHLKILREEHMVFWEERYPYIYYSPNVEQIMLAKKMLKVFFGRIIPGKKGKKKPHSRKA